MKQMQVDVNTNTYEVAWENLRDEMSVLSL